MSRSRFRSCRGALAAFALVLGAGWASRSHAAPVGDADVAKERDALERHAKEPFEQRAREAALRALGRIGGRAAAEGVASVMDDPFVHLRDHAVSAFIAMCEGPRSAESIAWLAETALFDRKSASLRRGAATALGVAGGATGARALARALASEGEAAVLLAIAEAIERSKDTTAAAALVPLFPSKDGELAGAAARAFGRVGAPGDAAAQALESVLASKSAMARAGAVDGLAIASPTRLAARLAALLADLAIEPRIAACDALAPLALVGEDTKTLAALAVALEDASWRVRAAAYEAAIGLWKKDAIPLVIERLKTETGRMRGDALRALRTLTGEDVGTDADLWRAWWQTRGPALELGPRPAPNAYGRVRRATPVAQPDGGDTRTAAFFRLPIRSTRLAFLFDFSGSMRDPVEGPGAGTKADLARAEFGRAASALAKEQAFDVFIYRYPSVFPPAPRLTRALGSLTPGGEAGAKKALAWLAKEEPKGWGAFYDALTAIAAEGVDTIVLLSDGVPSRGTYDRDFRLLTEFAKANRFRRVAVDAVLVGKKGSDRRFMADLADLTGGRFEDATAAVGGK